MIAEAATMEDDGGQLSSAANDAAMAVAVNIKQEQPDEKTTNQVTDKENMYNRVKGKETPDGNVTGTPTYAKIVNHIPLSPSLTAGEDWFEHM